VGGGGVGSQIRVSPPGSFPSEVEFVPRRKAGGAAGSAGNQETSEVGPGRYCSPPHTMPCHSTNEGTKCESMTWLPLGVRRMLLTTSLDVIEESRQQR
jgi:hypothetical protein